MPEEQKQESAKIETKDGTEKNQEESSTNKLKTTVLKLFN